MRKRFVVATWQYFGLDSTLSLTRYGIELAHWVVWRKIDGDITPAHRQECIDYAEMWCKENDYDGLKWHGKEK